MFSNKMFDAINRVKAGPSVRFIDGEHSACKEFCDGGKGRRHRAANIRWSNHAVIFWSLYIR